MEAIINIQPNKVGTRLRSKVFSLGQILNKPKEKEEKIVFGFPLHKFKFKFGGLGLESRRPIP